MRADERIVDAPRVPEAPAATFDSIVTAAVVAECQNLAGARVQRIHQAGADGVALAVRHTGRSHLLFASVHPRWGRFHVASEVAPTDPSPFVHLLRSRLEGATLRTIDAPPFERIIVLTLDGLEGPQELIIEIMGRHSNLILCADGRIIGAHTHIGADRSRVREVLPHRPYVRPPQSRPDPMTATAADLAFAAHTAADQSAWRTVLAAVAGIGPALAWEACLRAHIDPTRVMPVASLGAVIEALRALGRTALAREFAPALYRASDGMPAAYAAFALQCFAHLRAEPSSMSAAVEAVTARAADAARFESLRQGASATVAHARERVRRALDAVAEDLRAAEDADRWRRWGELILAYLSRITPGATALEVPDFDGAPVRITLDPARSGVENAQRYFKRYTRAQAARKKLPARQAALQAELAFLDAAATAIAQAETEDDLWEIEQDLIAAGLRPRARSQARPRAVDAGRSFDLDGGFQVRVGRSGRENDRLTFEVAGPDDLWFHVRAMPGAHVILTSGRRKPGNAAVEAAARIAAYYSAGRGSAKVPVDVTARRHVRRMRGGRPGQVIYTHERTVTVSPGLPDDVQVPGA